MQSISLFVELLRTRPRVLLAAMIALQVALWTLVPVLFYAAPPGELPLVLAIGHEFQFGTEFGPPLAFWLAEIAYRIAGMTGVYLLSQLCIGVTFWAVFALGRLMVGAPQAIIAVLLMGGVAVFSVPTPEFGPAILAAPLWALILFHYWAGSRRGGWLDWVALGAEAGLLLLTTYAGLILIGLLVLYTLVTAYGRAQIDHVGPWIAGVMMVAVLFPYLIWLDLSSSINILDVSAILNNVHIWGRLVVTLILSHAGMVILILLCRGWFEASQAPAPEVTRVGLPSAARGYVYFFALAPIVATGLFTLFSRRPENFLAPPLVVMSGLAVVIAAGERIKIAHQYLIGYAWVAMMVLPPILVAFAIVLQPWILAADLSVGQPAAQMGQFFSDNFARRTGRPLPIVAGDTSLASLVALGASSRPRLYLESAPADRPRVTKEDIAEMGAVILWRAVDSTGRPPPDIERQFPELAVEVPRAFARQYQGRMPLMRIGWGMIRPRTAGPVSEPGSPPVTEREPALVTPTESAPSSPRQVQTPQMRPAPVTQSEPGNADPASRQDAAPPPQPRRQRAPRVLHGPE